MIRDGMGEARRREYLAVLGVPLFMARAPLPGAAESEPVALAPAVPAMAPAPSGPVGAEPVSVAPAVTQRPALAETVAVLQQPARQASPQVSEPAPVVVASPAPMSDQPSFSCRLLRVRPGLAVLLDLGVYPDLGAAERQLWQAICRAFDWQPGQLAGDFSWPLKAGPRGGMLGSGSEVARGFLQGWLGRDLRPEDRLLVLGPALADFVERPHRLLPSLAELLASPLAKRALWRQLAGDAPV